MGEFGEDVVPSEINEDSDVNETEMDDELSDELEASYASYMENDEQGTFKHDVKRTEEIEEKEQIKCRNESLEGQEHPETGVPFERKQVEVDGKQYDVVVPRFESAYDAQLPENLYEATDREQFKECNAQLKKEIETNKELQEKFDDEQLEQIEDGETPDGYTWHHDAESGKMQLVDTEIHQKTGHTGGRAIWGGGTESR